MKLIVGLGNPEDKYVGTRHNVGFDVADLLASKLGATFKSNVKKAEVATVMYKGEKVLIAKPQTYMNLSGESVAPLADYYHIPTDDILVIVDDVNLPVGRLRIRPEGSAGGHNGLKNIILNLATDEFARLRIGVGGGEKESLISHVLGKIPKEEKDILNKIYETSVEAALLFCEDEIEEAMNKYNSTNLTPKEEDV